jgi:hypothetical protein
MPPLRSLPGRAARPSRRVPRGPVARLVSWAPESVRGRQAKRQPPIVGGTIQTPRRRLDDVTPVSSGGAQPCPSARGDIIAISWRRR